MKAFIKMLLAKIKLALMLLLLSWDLFKMKQAGKKYAKENPNGTIKSIKEFDDFDFQSLNGKRVILFFVYKPKMKLMYERFFSFLKKLNREIIVISNDDLPQAFIDKYKNDVIYMASRYNIGRDFGAYKEFMQLLFKHNIQLKDLIICNDSMFANMKQADNRFIDFMHATIDYDFVGAAEFFGEPNYHVQSYFLKFSNNVLNGANFRKFWNDFFITDNRRANIHNGEIKLSQSIIKDGYYPKVFLASDTVINRLVDNKDNLFRFLSEFSANHHLDGSSRNWSKDFNEMWLTTHKQSNTTENQNLHLELLKVEIAKLVNRSSLISIVPFLIVDEFGFPFLKRDLVYHEIIDWMLIRQHASNFDQDLLEEYLHEQRIKKRPWYLKLKERVMFKAGII